MKRQRFRLGSVLKHYELQKQRAEQDLQQATHVLVKIDEEIAKLDEEIVTLATSVGKDAKAFLSPAGWMACSRKSEHLGRLLGMARVRRARQAEVVEKCYETRKRWAIAEETLLLLQRKIESANDAEEAHASQVQLQEMLLRRALGHDAGATPAN